MTIPCVDGVVFLVARCSNRRILSCFTVKVATANDSSISVVSTNQRTLSSSDQRPTTTHSSRTPSAAHSLTHSLHPTPASQSIRAHSVATCVHIIVLNDLIHQTAIQTTVRHFLLPPHSTTSYSNSYSLNLTHLGALVCLYLSRRHAASATANARSHARLSTSRLLLILSTRCRELFPSFTLPSLPTRLCRSSFSRLHTSSVSIRRAAFFQLL